MSPNFWTGVYVNKVHEKFRFSFWSLIYLFPEWLLHWRKETTQKLLFIMININTFDFTVTLLWSVSQQSALGEWIMETCKAQVGKGVWLRNIFPFAQEIWAFNGFSSHLHEHMRSVFEMNFCECVRKLIISVSLCVCMRFCNCMCACMSVFLHVSPPPTERRQSHNHICRSWW